LFLTLRATFLFQYDALYFTESGFLEHRTKDVKRRFREFINLQARLEDNENYKQSLRGIDLRLFYNCYLTEIQRSKNEVKFIVLKNLLH